MGFFVQNLLNQSIALQQQLHRMVGPINFVGKPCVDEERVQQGYNDAFYLTRVVIFLFLLIDILLRIS